MSQSSNKETPWSQWHNRLNKFLITKENLLPKEVPLLLSVSGGQDSMALLKLILDLKRLYKWELHVWHGDHGWHLESKTFSEELESWCKNQGLNFICQRANKDEVKSEVEARNWRYNNLSKIAKSLYKQNNDFNCKHVLTGHTASDKAETLVLNLARGAYLGGLSSLKESRQLERDIHLIRPLIIFSREETAQICNHFNLPIWIDPSNQNLKFNRNKIRHEIIPRLEEMYPGSSMRIAALSEKLAEVKNNQDDLINFGIRKIKHGEKLCRQELLKLSKDNQRNILAKWLTLEGVPMLSAAQLEDLRSNTCRKLSSGSRKLSKGWKIKWNKNTIQIINSINQ